MTEKETTNQEENKQQQDVTNNVDKSPEDTSNSENLGYEFSQEENMVFEELSVRIAFVARIMVIASILGIIRSIWVVQTNIYSGILSFLIVGIMCTVGFLHFGAAKSFKKIVSTEGDDINFVMIAMNALRKYYQAFCWLAWVAIVAVFSFTLVKIINTLV